MKRLRVVAAREGLEAIKTYGWRQENYRVDSPADGWPLQRSPTKTSSYKDLYSFV
jgi:hypothetical protein